MMVWCVHFACWMPKATHTHTLTVCSTFCFSATAMVARTLLSIALHVHCLFCFLSVESSCKYVTNCTVHGFLCIRFSGIRITFNVSNFITISMFVVVDISNI
jgi:hypothetical protein